MLQADSEKLRQAWVQAVQASIASAYRESPDSCYSEVWPSQHPHGCERVAECGREAAPAGCSHASLPVQCEHVFVSRGHMHAHSGTQAMLQLSPPVPAPRTGVGEGPMGRWRPGLLRAERPLTPSPEAGPHGISIHEQHRLCYGLSGAQCQGRERAAACAECGRQQPVWRLWPAGPPLGQHQPGRAALHRVLRNPQVGPPGGAVEVLG